MGMVRNIQKVLLNTCKIKPKPINEAYYSDSTAVRVKSFEDIPGPRSFPGVGTLLHYFIPFGPYSFEKLHQTYEKMHRQYGDIVREVMTANRVIVHLFNPADMYAVYRTDGSNPRRVSHRVLARYRNERPHLYSGAGLFPSNGEEWYRFRHLFKDVLVVATQDKSYNHILEDVTNDLIKTVQDSLDSNAETDLQPLLFSWGLECVGAITLNRRLGCFSKDNTEARSLVKAAEDTHTAVYKTENVPFGYKANYKKLEDAQDLLSSVVGKYMYEALKDPDFVNNESCLLPKLMKCKGASEKDVFTMILDMFLAGIDTTAFALSFALYHLARNQRVQNKLRQEVLQYLPKKESRMANSKHRMKYLKAVLEETLRLNPVAVGTGRLLNEDLVLGGYLVPADTLVLLQHQVACRNEKYYKNARVFEPERMLDNGGRSTAFSPFGSGTRICIGQIIANKELRIAISKLVREYEISYHYEDIDTISRLINVPDKPLKLRFKKIED